MPDDPDVASEVCISLPEWRQLLVQRTGLIAHLQ